ncbi:hypothetical protein AAE02nite_08540 [Adhaeribacter aerolatus]|uniref:DUF1800 domain-containing protein n=1 Tax=Adhaeribacter aerolatus TaxID=670289 RepID=A0A512AU38_9BACT|nr:DUF1800 domain-containing protein [Adhaeribacter aerolatus]GEO03190.1 hypothetical protein AAE02nite_08540 [Adhaeribacter aerolatus]
MKADTYQRQLQHLYWRTGFGPSPAQMQQAPGNLNKAVKGVFSQSVSYAPLPLTITDFSRLPKGQLSPEERRRQMQQARRELAKINTTWLQTMATSPAQLREKMAFFWHGHFACRTQRPEFALNQVNLLRQHALGKFSDLLMAVAKDPAMLQFLNNQQNRKLQPNENFARELLELFTLGRGHYSEEDIKNAARAFTGWGYDAEGMFVFRERQHDAGTKTFLGKIGNFTGEDILRIILDQPQTAKFLTTKIYRFFVNDTPDAAVIQQLSEQFYATDYDIQALLQKIFSTDWFYAPANIGTRIKSPVELLTGLQRAFAIQFQDAPGLLVVQRALGQVLLYPPNVGGWPGGRNWIDSSSLMFRMKLPQTIFAGASLNISLKDDDIDMLPQLSQQERTFNRRLRVNVNLQPFRELLAKVPPRAIVAQTAAFLLQVPLNAQLTTMLQNDTDEFTPENRLNALALRLSSLPEYQLC